MQHRLPSCDCGAAFSGNPGAEAEPSPAHETNDVVGVGEHSIDAMTLTDPNLAVSARKLEQDLALAVRQPDDFGSVRFPRRS